MIRVRNLIKVICCLAFFTICAFLIGCLPSSQLNSDKYYETGQIKPTVVFLPVINSSGKEYQWDLSDQFTHQLRLRILDQGNIFLTPTEHAMQLKSHFTPQQLFGKSLDFTQRLHSSCDFLLAVEILDQQEERPINEAQDSCFELRCRIRLIHFYKKVAKVVLQEVITKQVPLRSFEKGIDYNILNPSHPKYKYTPMAKAYLYMEREIVSRVNTYVNLNR